MTMGTRIAVMRKGVLQQEGAPQEVYDTPRNLFVATFIGSPGMNLFRAQVTDDAGDGLACELRDQRIELGSRAPAALGAYRGGEVAVGVRPEHLRGQPLNGQAKLSATVVLSEALGAERLLHVALPADPVATADVMEIVRDIDVALASDLAAEEQDHHVVLIGRVDTSFAPTTNTTVDLGLEITKLHFFDLTTGAVIH
jgi:multiple sugar transport system ATP-binding protein